MIVLVAQTVKNLPAMRETWVWSLGWKEPLEKGKATLSSILAWRNPWTEKPGSLQSIGLQRVEHDWRDLTHAHIFFISLLRWRSGKEFAYQCRWGEFKPWVTKIPWRRARQPTPVFWPGKLHGQKSLVGYSPWGCKESDTTDWLSLHTQVCM